MGKLKYTIEDVRELVESKGGILLTEVYTSCVTKLHVRCGECGREWFPIFRSIQNDHWCRCRRTNKTKYTIDDVREFVEAKGGTLLTEVYTNCATKLHIRCGECGHEWFPNFSYILKGYWCYPCCPRKTKYTIEEVRTFVEAKGGTLLTEVYVNSKTKLCILCNVCKNEFFQRWAKILKGSWCKTCSKWFKYTIEDAREAVEAKGGTLLTEVYTNCSTKLHIRCGDCGREWRTLLGNIHNDRWCRCRPRKTKYTIDDVREFVEAKGGVLLTEIYTNSSTKLHIRCLKDNYEFFPRWEDLLKNNWCRRCAGNEKKTIEEIRALIESKDGTLLTEVYVGAHSDIEIRCNRDGLIWITTGHAISRGYWCKRCARQEKKTIEEVRDFVESKDGTLLSDTYVNSDSHVEVRCNKDGNVWKISWGNLQSGHWCSRCSLGKSQRALHDLLEDVLAQPALSNYRGFDWLTSPKGRRQELDIYFPKLKLAVEYDGAQHFRPVQFGGISEERAQDNFDHTIKLDVNKNIKIAQNTEDVKSFIRFSYKEPITKEHIIQRLMEIKVI